MTRALQSAIAEACLGAHADDELARDLRGFLARHGVDPDDIEAILAAPARLPVYRSLVRNGLSGVVLRILPRTRARLNAACGGRFDADLAAFVGDVGPRTHHLRDVPAEFFAWAEPRWRSDATVPRYLLDLAAHELAHFSVSAAVSSADAGPAPAAGAPGADAPEAGAIAIDRPLAFAGSVWIARYGWAVHELSPDADATHATDEPSRREVCLFAYRDAAHAVRWLELTPLACTILEHLLAGEALGRAVQRACADHATAPADVLPEVARLLADLGERGALVGGAP